MRIFKEEQRFTQTWLIVLMIATNIPVLILISKTYLDQKINLINFIIIISFILIASGSIFVFKLKTRIDDIGIHYQFFPFHFRMKTILWKNIKEVSTRKYDAVAEFGGWGLKGGRLWKKDNGIAINVKGDIGIQLILFDDKKILIGTQKQEAVDNILSKYSNKI